MATRIIFEEVTVWWDSLRYTFTGGVHPVDPPLAQSIVTENRVEVLICCRTVSFDKYLKIRECLFQNQLFHFKMGRNWNHTLDTLWFGSKFGNHTGHTDSTLQKTNLKLQLHLKSQTQCKLQLCLREFFLLHLALHSSSSFVSEWCSLTNPVPLLMIQSRSRQPRSSYLNHRNHRVRSRAARSRHIEEAQALRRKAFSSVASPYPRLLAMRPSLSIHVPSCYHHHLWGILLKYIIAFPPFPYPRLLAMRPSLSIHVPSSLEHP